VSRSLAEQVARLSEKQREDVLHDLNMEVLEWDWRFWGRPEQFAPEGEWRFWLIVAGRGFGKTRAGAEWVREMAMAYPGCRIALVGRTTGDVMKVMLGGESGLMNIGPESERPDHQISKGRVVWPNGSVAETFSAEEPDQLRGPQFNFAWADEAAAWKFVKDASGLNAWDNLDLGVRLEYRTNAGIVEPRIVATTTPKRTPFMQEMLSRADSGDGSVAITRGSTYDNAGNLARSFLEGVTGVYAGTALARQELEGLMLEDQEGALWTPELIDDQRWDSSRTPATALRLVAVDPSVAENPRDECGIVVVGSTRERDLWRRHAWVLEDASLLGSPDVWTTRVVEMARKWNAPVVVEKNQGGQLVVDALKNKDATLRVFTVSAQVGKKLRAEPVVLPYEQKRVHHWGVWPELEGQLTTWDPEISKDSPDRLDALVHGLTALLIKPPPGFGSGPVRAKSAAGRQVAGIKNRGTGKR
jgi:phage terminase large subunit-like protein